MAAIVTRMIRILGAWVTAGDTPPPTGTSGLGFSPLGTSSLGGL